MLLPPMQAIGTRASCSAISAPTWAIAAAPPTDRTTQVGWRVSASCAVRRGRSRTRGLRIARSGRKPRCHRAAILGVGDLDPVAPARLRPVHGRIGQPQERALAAALISARRQVVAVGRDADRGGDPRERVGVWSCSVSGSKSAAVPMASRNISAVWPARGRSAPGRITTNSSPP